MRTAKELTICAVYGLVVGLLLGLAGCLSDGQLPIEVKFCKHGVPIGIECTECADELGRPVTAVPDVGPNGEPDTW